MKPFSYLFVSHSSNRRHLNALSEGRAESSCEGLSGRDAATTAWMQEVERRRMPKTKAAMGKGRLFAACPWNGDGERKRSNSRRLARRVSPWRSQGRMQGQSLLGYFRGDLPTRLGPE